MAVLQCGPKRRLGSKGTGHMYTGWKVVMGLFMVMALSSGLGFYNHAVLIQALAKTGAFTVTSASSAVSLFFVVSGLTGLVIAPLLERFDARWIICAGAVISALGLACLSMVDSLFELYVVYFFFGIGFCASGLLPATTLIARWFVVHRARALSVASTGLSVGGMVITPLSAHWVSSMALGPATQLMALIYALGIIPLTLLLVRSRPEDMGQSPDGGTLDGQVSSPATMDGIPFSDAVKDPFYRYLNVTYVFVMLAQVGGIAHQFGVVSERLPGEGAAMMLSILPVTSVIGRLAGGFLLERFSMLTFTLVMIVVQASALLLIAVSSTVWSLGISLGLLGLSVGNLLMLQPLIVAERYGLRDYSRLFSWANLFSVIGVAGGPGVLGAIYGQVGNFMIPYLFASAMGVFAALSFLACIRVADRPVAHFG
jgi:MFS family permease